MSAANVQRIRKLYDDFAAGNVEAVLGAFSPDITWNEAENNPYADGNPYIGPQAVLEGVFARCVGDWDNFTVQIDEILDAGDTIVALGRYQGVYKANNTRQDSQLAHIWRIADGVITGFQQYTDTAQLARITAEHHRPFVSR